VAKDEYLFTACPRQPSGHIWIKARIITAVNYSLEPNSFALREEFAEVISLTRSD